MKKRLIHYVLLSSLAAGLAGCENLPGDRTTQSSVAGGAAGSVVGASMADNQLLGALIGGAVGAGGGYLIGARTDWFEKDSETTQRNARQAIENAKNDPATVNDVYDSNSADLNNDGFVTTDELVAMERAALTDEAILDRLRRTDQVFDLSQQQEQSLLDAGLSRYVVNEMQNINRAQRDRLIQPSVLGSPAS